MSTQAPIIRLEKVSKRFGPLVVLDEVDLDVYPGQTLVVIGPSGCGKTVLIKHIVGLLRPDSGRVYFREHDLTRMNERELVEVRRHMGFLFQGGALFDSMTVEQNVTFPLEDHGVGDRESRGRRCREVLGMMGMDGMQNRYPEELSGGQRKRVALARAIALGPEVILYDEPTTGLDPIRSDLINELILKLQGALHTTAVVVTHDMASARKVGNRIAMLYGGKIIADAPPDELAKSDQDVVRRFITGTAGEQELAEIRGSRMSADAQAAREES
jgi:phospholipid/cholesterol/gamma-HCH transport system ATP-binding protein